jgi:hypothetical protein
MNNKKDSSIINTLRKPKFFGMAIFDLSGTFLIAVIIAKIFKWSIIATFTILMVIAVFTHFIFDIPTQLNYYIGFNERLR